MMTKVYLNGCGRLNLRTGQNLHFNLDDPAAAWSDATLTLVKTREGKLKVIGGFGEALQGEMTLYTAGHRWLGTARAIGHYRATPEGRAQLAERIGTNTVAFATLD